MDKFKALVHLIIQDCKDPKNLGATRLNKILWFSDVEAYRLTGNSITGAKYLRRKKGPVPAHILRSLEELKSEGKIQLDEPEFRYDPRLFTSLKNSDDGVFSKNECDLVKIISDHICHNFTADGISEASHDDIWDAAGDGEEIPLEATLISNGGNYPAAVTNWADSVVAATP